MINVTTFERREITHKYEEVYLYATRVGILGLCDFKGRTENGFREHKGDS